MGQCQPQCQCFGLDARPSPEYVGLTKVADSSRHPNGEPAFCWRTFQDKPIKADEDTLIEFFTDVEGNWEYFERFIASSQVLYWQEDEERGVWGPGTLMLRDNCVLVFGGDAQDKGDGDIRFVKTLLSLKHRYPDRVGIILGNRDLDKLRFWAELDEDHDPSLFDCWWLANGGVSFDQFLVKNGERLNLEKGRLAALHWMLECNMGCQETTFGNRKKELAMIRATRASNDDVIESFRECVRPHGEDPYVLDLLRVGKLAIVIRDSLFVHADVNERSIGYVPPHKRISNEESDTRIANQQSGWRSCVEWTDALNRWKDEELEDYMKRPGFLQKGDMMERGGLALIDYCVPGGCNKRTLSHANPFANGNAKLARPEVEKQLQEWNIMRVLSGHQPHGQSPSVARHPESGMLRITCDTSYSDMGAEKISNRANNRGQVWSNVRIRGPITTIEGSLADGLRHKAVLHNDMRNDELPNALVGRQLKDNSWIKTVILDRSNHPACPPASYSEDRKFLLTVLGQGFKLDSKQLGVVPCCLMLKDEFRTPVPDLFSVKFHQFNGDSFLRKAESVDESPKDDDMLLRFFARSGTLQSPKVAPKTGIIHRPSLIQSLEPSVFTNSELDNFNTYLIAPSGVLTNPYDPMKKRSREDIVQHATARLNALIKQGKRILFVSNNSHKSRRELAQDQINAGVQLPLANAEDHVISTAYTCAWYLKLANKKRPFVVCSHTGLLEEFRKIGITDYVATINDDGTAKPEYLQRVDNLNTVMDLVERYPGVDSVVAGWDQQMSTLKMAVAAMYIRRDPNVNLVTCSIDHSAVLGGCRDGEMVYGVGNGVIAQSICTCLGKSIDFALNVGKSAGSCVMLDLMAKSKEEGGYAVDFKSSVFIGDTLDTDIAIAHAVDMKSVLVFSGVTSKEDLDAYEKHHGGISMPTYTCPTLAEL